MTTTSAPPAIQLTGVQKTFAVGAHEPVHAVRTLDLRIDPGEIVAFLGPNGAGKTTTLDMVLGLTEPTAGDIAVLGQRPRTAVDAGRVGAVLQTGGLLADVTVRETVQLIASTYRQRSGVDDVIARADLQELVDRRVSKCSGGEQQRLKFALALLPDPDLLVLDEPTAGMDVNARRQFWDTMRADSDSGRTVVFATHYLDEADSFADRIVMIAGGRIIADGSTESIRARAGGRTVSATFADGDLPRAQEVIGAWPRVGAVEWRHNRVSAQLADSDELARAILSELGGRDVEIVTANLDNAFRALTDEAARTEVPA